MLGWKRCSRVLLARRRAVQVRQSMFLKSLSNTVSLPSLVLSPSSSTPSSEDITPLATQQHHGKPSSHLSKTTLLSLYPSSSTMEQLAIMEVCLATGSINRAKRIFQAIRHSFYEDLKQKNVAQIQAQDYETDLNVPYIRQKLRFTDMVPVAIHTAFLRSFFRQAIVYSEGKKSGSATRRRAFVSEAWEWFEMLLKDERLYGRLDDSAWAVMMKGLVATRLAHVGNKVLDPAAPHLQPISHLYGLIRDNRRSLDAILREPIFTHTGIAGLNEHTALEVTEELASNLAEHGDTDALADLEAVKQRLIETIRYSDDFRSHTSGSQMSQTSAIPAEGGLHTRDALAATVQKLEPARRSKEEDVPFRLGSLLGNLDTITGQKLQSKDPYVRQELLEESAYDAARWQSMHEHDQLDKIGLGAETKLKGNKLQTCMNEWLTELTVALTKELEEEETAKVRASEQFGSLSDVKRIIRALGPEKAAFITIVDTLRVAGNASSLLDGTKATRAIIMLGRTIEDEYGAESWKILYPDIYKKAMDAKRPEAAVRQFMKQQGIEAGAANEAHRQGYGDEADELRNIEDPLEREFKIQARARAMPWTQKMRAKVGGYLIKMLIDVAKVKRTALNPFTQELVEEQQPAFYQSYQFSRGQKVGVIKLNPYILKRLDRDNIGSAVFPRYLPMLVPPKPWTKWNSGGYRIHTTEIIRMRDSPEQTMYMKMASDQGHLDQVYAALDVLGSTAWRINQSIFDIISQVWNSGQALADIPVDNAETAFPDPEIPPDANWKDPKLREAYRVQMKEIRNLRTKTHSQRCNLNYVLEIARAYLGETFYFPHNVDFRGRAYPIPPNMSHIGDDMSRGILEFAEGRKLGKRGLQWLYIHVANTAGFDKASFSNRESFSKDHLDEIMDSADKPLDGKRWWLEADDPWQCLAACMELTRALRSANPEEYESHLPIQQDGTCNGLQHYAALGGDKVGAGQVNLSAGDKPADVYTAVANMVNRELEKDLTSSSDSVRHIATLLKGKVTRKVVKQTVMTTVYGVTFIGAKRQIQKQLKDRGDIPTDDQYTCATYLANHVLSSIGDLFKGASTIQLWLSVCARLIGRSIRPDETMSLATQFKEPMASVIWTTPLGLPVCQPYRKIKKSQIDTSLQSVFITDPNTPSPIDPRAQATAFPPNYIHSLDATHMMMTAVECSRRGLNYASVHDSYWTHACDVDEMSAILRDCFIKLHSQDLLGNLRREFLDRYEGFIVRRSGATKAAEKMTSEIEKARQKHAGAVTADRSKGRREDMDLQGIAQDLGTTILPPMTIASDNRLLKAAIEEHMDEEAAERLEEASFAIDAQDSTEEKEPENRAELLHPAASSGKTKKRKTKTEIKTRTSGSETMTGPEYYELGNILPPVPLKGDFDLETIRDSPYFFS